MIKKRRKRVKYFEDYQEDTATERVNAFLDSLGPNQKVEEIKYSTMIIPSGKGWHCTMIIYSEKI